MSGMLPKPGIINMKEIKSALPCHQRPASSKKKTKTKSFHYEMLGNVHNT